MFYILNRVQRTACVYSVMPHVWVTTAASRNIGTTPVSRPLFHRQIRRSLRTYTNGAVTQSPPTRILPTIEHEHRELEYHAQQILNSADPDERTRYQNLLTWELARHIVSEELVVYPALAKHVDDGQDRADKRRIEHQTIKEQLNAFQGLRATDPRFAPTLEALLEDLKYHF